MEASGVESTTPDTLARQSHAIRQDQGSFDRNRYEQEQALGSIREIWEKLGDSDRSLLLQQYCDLFPRTREAAQPQVCLRKIIELTKEEDTQRALRVRADMYRGFRLEPGEEIYPTTGWLGRYLDYSKWNKVPMALHFWAGAAVMGAAIRRNYFIDKNIDYIWMNQFIILGGDAGNGKSQAMKTARDILRRMNQQIKDMDVYSEANFKAFKANLIPSDITPPDLKFHLSNLCSGYRHVLPAGQAELRPPLAEAVAIMFSDELSNTVGKAKYGAGAMIPLLTELCFNDEYHSSTKMGGEEDIERMAFSLLACTQPGWLRNTITADTKEGGFTDRVNIIYRERTNRVYDDIELPVLDPLMADKLAEELRLISCMVGPPRVLRLNETAEEMYREWYHKEHPERSSTSALDGSHTMDRRTIHLFRLMGILAVSEAEDLPFITARTFTQALQIMEAEDIYRPQFMKLANESEGGVKVRILIQWLESNGGWVLYRSYAQNPLFREWGKVVKQETLEDAIDGGQAQIYEKGKGGKWLGVSGKIPDRVRV